MIQDSNGIIGSITWAKTVDYGDGLAETGRIWFLANIIANFKLPIPSGTPDLKPIVPSSLQDSHGHWIRGPGEWSDPKDVSRDQIDPMMMCLCLFPMFDGYVKGTLNDIVRNWFRYPNGDICSPEHLSHFFRHKKGWYFKPLFYLGDVFTLINSLIISFVTGTNTDKVDNDLNFIISLAYAEYWYSTFISRLAARIYFRHRPNGYLWALKLYYTPDDGNEDLINFYLPVLEWLKERTK
jgi:hypothetical protein